MYTFRVNTQVRLAAAPDLMLPAEIPGKFTTSLLGAVSWRTMSAKNPSEAHVLERLSAYCDSLPRLGWPNLRAVVTSSMKRLSENPDRINAPAFVER